LAIKKNRRVGSIYILRLVLTVAVGAYSEKVLNAHCRLFLKKKVNYALLSV
jgi:hypothetical protein